MAQLNPDTNPQTQPTLLGITHDGPVRVRELGTRHQGLVWVVQPEDFPYLVEWLNRPTTPVCRIEPL